MPMYKRVTPYLIGTVLWVPIGPPAHAADEAAGADAAPAVASTPAETADESADTADAPEPADADKPKAISEMSAEELREHMDQLEKQMQETRNAFRQAAAEDQPDPVQQAEQDVAKIVLPDNPTRGDYEQYVADIENLANGLRTISSNSPIVDKLKAVPVEHIDLVLAMLGKGNIAGYFAQYALNDYDWTGSKQTIVEKLGEHPALIGIVLQMGWVEDCREVILRRFADEQDTVPLAWFQAAVELREPSIYPRLHEIAVHSPNASTMIGMLGTIEGFDVEQTIMEAWEIADRPNHDGPSRSSLAPLAVGLGNVDALGVLINQLDHGNGRVSFSVNYRQSPQDVTSAIRTNVLRHLDFTGSNMELVNWYQENKGKLVYDFVRERFVLPEEF